VFPLSGGLSLGRPVELAARGYFRSINEAGGSTAADRVLAEDTADPNRTPPAPANLTHHILRDGPSFRPSRRICAVPRVEGCALRRVRRRQRRRFTSPTTVSIGASIAPHARVLIPYMVREERTPSASA